ncbi:hypothetical protein RDABS01_009973 [Bienertia sinuspersici]
MRRNMHPTELAYATILSCCANSPFYLKVDNSCSDTEGGCINDIIVGSSLIDMYCKSGDVEGAKWKAENLMIQPSQLITACSHSGLVDEGIKILSQ